MQWPLSTRAERAKPAVKILIKHLSGNLSDLDEEDSGGMFSESRSFET